MDKLDNFYRIEDMPIALSKDDYLEVVVALDQEAYRESQNNHAARADKLRDLKWKVFALMVKAEKEAANGNA